MKRPITSIEELKKLASGEEGIDVFILLNYGLRSSKRIEWNRRAGRFWILNLIDDSTQWLTEKQLKDTAYTLIGRAIEKNALFCDEA